ncbi:MAG: hypothetical protein FWB95_02445 [Treponema sp.]|nr:hypothetical protein [Treponema sp.]
MKKVIFLILMAFAMVGLVSALDDTAHPPGGITLDVEKIACFGAAFGCPVYQVTVLADYQEAVFLLPAGFTALLTATIENPVNSWEQAAGVILRTDWKQIDTGQEINYFLRL